MSLNLALPLPSTDVKTAFSVKETTVPNECIGDLKTCITCSNNFTMLTFNKNVGKNSTDGFVKFHDYDVLRIRSEESCFRCKEN
ncbi:hypothetical protein JTB14_023830 [Gonioctena quinquepunctata]|nr:hypothetical protein JTB14_023830 [Gonioctena quinquepunctata]